MYKVCQESPSHKFPGRKVEEVPGLMPRKERQISKLNKKENRKRVLRQKFASGTLGESREYVAFADSWSGEPIASKMALRFYQYCSNIKIDESQRLSCSRVFAIPSIKS
jgi:hypothetical protein